MQIMKPCTSTALVTKTHFKPLGVWIALYWDDIAKSHLKAMNAAPIDSGEFFEHLHKALRYASAARDLFMRTELGRFWRQEQ